MRCNNMLYHRPNTDAICWRNDLTAGVQPPAVVLLTLAYAVKVATLYCTYCIFHNCPRSGYIWDSWFSLERRIADLYPRYSENTPVTLSNTPVMKHTVNN